MTSRLDPCPLASMTERRNAAPASTDKSVAHTMRLSAITQDYPYRAWLANASPFPRLAQTRPRGAVSAWPARNRGKMKIIATVEKVETVVVYAMIAMLLVAIILGTAALGRLLFGIVIRPPMMMMIEPAELFASFGMFLIIVIGLELLKVLKLHLTQRRLRPELVIEVAMIAVCNKVVTLDPKAMTADTLLGLAALLLGLAAGYFVFVRARPEES